MEDDDLPYQQQATDLQNFTGTTVEDFDFSYGVYANGARVICFAEGRIGYREWARRSGRLADIHSIDDRLDHDVDELLA